MKASLAILVAAVVLLGLGVVTGVVGLRYPRVIENQPLHDPIAVAKIEGALITLTDRRILELEGAAPKGAWQDLRSGSSIDIEDDGSGEVIVWGNKPGWICGTPWAQPLRIPLIAQDTYRNRREMLGFASYKEARTKAEQAEPSGGDKPSY